MKYCFTYSSLRWPVPVTLQARRTFRPGIRRLSPGDRPLPGREVRLDSAAPGPLERYMAQSIFVFDFGTNEEAAQQARHKVEGWKQGFRLGNKMTIKFDREDAAAEGDGLESAPAKPAKKSAEKKSAGKKGDGAEGATHVRVL